MLPDEFATKSLAIQNFAYSSMEVQLEKEYEREKALAQHANRG